MKKIRRTPQSKSVAAPAVEPIPAPAPQPIHQLSLKQWREQNAGLQADLRKLIDSPVFLLARQSIIESAFPGVEPAAKPVPGVTADAANNALALRYAHRSGIAFAFRMLRYLIAPAEAPMPNTSHGALLMEDE